MSNDYFNPPNSVWPNGLKRDGEGYVTFYPTGTNKTPVPTSSSEWPKGNKLVSPFVYQDDKLVGFCDTKAMTVNDSGSTTMPYEHIEADFSSIKEGTVTIDAPNAIVKKLKWAISNILKKCAPFDIVPNAAPEEDWFSLYIKANCLYFDESDFSDAPPVSDGEPTEEEISALIEYFKEKVKSRKYSYTSYPDCDALFAMIFALEGLQNYQTMLKSLPSYALEMLPYYVVGDDGRTENVFLTLKGEKINSIFNIDTSTIKSLHPTKFFIDIETKMESADISPSDVPLITALIILMQSMLYKWEEINGDFSKLETLGPLYMKNPVINCKNLNSLLNMEYTFMSITGEKSEPISWNIPLPSLVFAVGAFAGKDIIRWDTPLPKLQWGGSMFNNTQLEEFNTTLPNLLDGEEMFQECWLSLTSLNNILSSIPVIPLEDKAIPPPRIVSSKVLADLYHEYYISTGKGRGVLDIGLRTMPEKYSTVDEWFLDELNMTVQDVLDAFTAKNWTVTLKSGSNNVFTNASTYSLRNNNNQIYTKLREVTYTPEIMTSEYISADETKFYKLTVAHITNEPEKYDVFNSIEEACEYYNIVPRDKTKDILSYPIIKNAKAKLNQLLTLKNSK